MDRKAVVREKEWETTSSLASCYASTLSYDATSYDATRNDASSYDATGDDAWLWLLLIN